MHSFASLSQSLVSGAKLKPSRIVRCSVPMRDKEGIGLMIITCQSWQKLCSHSTSHKPTRCQHCSDSTHTKASQSRVSTSRTATWALQADSSSDYASDGSR